MKKYLQAVLACFLLLCTLSGCKVFNRRMPLNGDITFYDISLTVDEKYVRDSSQSSENLWIFEHGNYKEYIILSKKDISGDLTVVLSEYLEYMLENGVNAEKKTFLENEAIFSAWTSDGVFCREVTFVHEGAVYAISLRGGTESDFDNLLHTVIKLQANAESNV